MISWNPRSGLHSLACNRDTDAGGGEAIKERMGGNGTRFIDGVIDS
jgi:hypothetical protein